MNEIPPPYPIYEYKLHVLFTFRKAFFFLYPESVK